MILFLAPYLVLTPSIKVISEEADNRIDTKLSEYWLVDPIDGTRGFVDGSDEFCINIALVQAGYPVLALIYVPVKNQYFVTTVNLPHAYGYFNGVKLSSLLTRRIRLANFVCWLVVIRSVIKLFVRIYLSSPFCDFKRCHSAINSLKFAWGRQMCIFVLVLPVCGMWRQVTY